MLVYLIVSKMKKMWHWKLKGRRKILRRVTRVGLRSGAERRREI